MPTIRRVAFVADGESWSSSIGLSAREILLRNGVQAAWIADELQAGTCFKLVLFDDDNVWPADWAGVERVIATHYPELAPKLDRHWAAIRRPGAWEELETQAGETFAQMDRRDGPMTTERFAAAADTCANARRFLAATLSLNQLFTGTGFTHDERGAPGKGTAEYFAANRLLSSVPKNQVVALRST